MGRDFSGTEPKLPCEPVSRWSLRLSALPKGFSGEATYRSLEQ
jgi:hypothetical protein